MKNLKLFKMLCFGFMLLLVGCADLRDPSSLKVTTCEALDMKLDSTTKDEVLDILGFYGYSVTEKGFKISNKINKNKKLPKSVLSFLSDVAGEQRFLDVQISEGNRMQFIFDKNQKLISFIVLGDKKVLDPLIANDNRKREVLISKDLSSKANKKIADLFSEFMNSPKNDKRTTKSKKATKSKKGSCKSKGNCDATIYFGKDFSIAINMHTDKFKDSALYSVASGGAIYQTILSVRDMFNLLVKFRATSFANEITKKIEAKNRAKRTR